jgi:hypothetical protein
MEIKVGIKVRCIDDHFEDDRTNPFRMSELNLPKRGKIYTVRAVVQADPPYGTGIRLQEIKNRTYYFDSSKRCREPIFSTRRFRIAG